jgi:hypothetical protein
VQKPTVPDSIQAPAGEELILMARATGFQIYVCRPETVGKPAWTLKAPDAELFDEQGKLIGKHFGGPTWQLNDGSQITGKLAAKVDAPNPMASADGDRAFWKRQAERCDVHPAGEHGGWSSTRKPRACCLGMHSAERGSGVQEPLFRGLLLLCAAVTHTLPLITLIKLIYADQNSSIRTKFKFVNPCHSVFTLRAYLYLRPVSLCYTSPSSFEQKRS